MRRLFIVGLLAVAGCAFDGTYRYPCQDPDNWDNTECKPPVCNVDGTCTETLLGFDPASEDGPATTVVVDTTQGVGLP